jgi:predicted GNAT family N-acyltransferase
MDWLYQVKDPVEQEIFHQVPNLLNLKVDLLFFDTTSTYFELDEEDEPVPQAKHGTVTDDEQKAAEGKPTGFRAYGKGADHRDDLPQVVIGMAVTRDGIRCGCGAGRGTRTTWR